MARSAIVGITLAAIVCLAFPAEAQQAPTSPTIGLPLPSIGLPLPPIGISPQEITQRSAPPSPPPQTPTVPPPIVILGTVPYMWGFETWQHSSRPGTIATSPEADSAAQPERATEIVSGLLQLDIKPGDAQIFVNGEFVGTVEDLDGRLELPEGVHRLEIRAARYEAHSFDARLVAGRTITYRVTLSTLSSPLPPLTPGPSATRSGQERPARPAQTFYLIPGCYLGNVPPEQVKLPPDCDMSRMITHTPGK